MNFYFRWNFLMRSHSTYLLSILFLKLFPKYLFQGFEKFRFLLQQNPFPPGTTLFFVSKTTFDIIHFITSLCKQSFTKLFFIFLRNFWKSFATLLQISGIHFLFLMFFLSFPSSYLFLYFCIFPSSIYKFIPYFIHKSLPLFIFNSNLSCFQLLLLFYEPSHFTHKSFNQSSCPSF